MVSRSERDPEAIALGARLRQVRELNGLSQRELARRAGVTNSNISLIEQGQISPSVGSLAKLLDAIPLSLAQFFALELDTSVGRVVRAEQTIRIEQPEFGLVTEHLPLTQDNPRLLERFELAPGADTGTAPLRLPGARAGWVLSGTLELTLGVRCYTLSEGDGFQLPKGQWLRARNPGASLTVVMVTAGKLRR